MAGFRTLLCEGNITPALLYAALSRAGFKHPVKAKVMDRTLYIRTNTPDLLVALQSREFDDAISAARPLRYGLIVDAGGYIGTAAISFALAFPEATIVSVEPSIENFEILKRNTRPFSNIICLNMALATESKTLGLRKRHTGECGFTTVDNPADCPTAITLHNVSTITLEDIINMTGKDGIDVLKIDIEGYEREIFSTPCSRLLNSRVILAELHDRIAPGCSMRFSEITATRKNTQSGEKILSVKA